MAPTTTRKEDFLGRDLANATPGTTQAKDSVGRDIIAGDKDYLGRSLQNIPWVATTAYTVNGTRVYVTGGTLVATVAGTSGAAAPTAPGAVGGTVVDGTVTWQRVE
jgi:hypothetical protein